MSKTGFDFGRFLVDKRLSISDLAARIGLPYISVYQWVKRGTLKLKYVKLLEEHFGDCGMYLVGQGTGDEGRSGSPKSTVGQSSVNSSESTEACAGY